MINANNVMWELMLLDIIRLNARTALTLQIVKAGIKFNYFQDIGDQIINLYRFINVLRKALVLEVFTKNITKRLNIIQCARRATVEIYANNVSKLVTSNIPEPQVVNVEFVQRPNLIQSFSLLS